jgi:hypothetical protein
MLHSNQTTSFIGQNFVGIYETTPIGNLEHNLVRSIVPLQKAFQCNIMTCISVGVHDNSAILTSEQGIVCTTVSLTNSTAVVAELGCMPTVHNVKHDTLVKATGNEDLLELEKRHPHNYLVELSSFGLESLKIFNRNISIILQGKISYLFDHLSYIGINKVELSGLQSSQGMKVIGTLHKRASSHDSLSLHPDMQSKVILIKNLILRREDSNGNSFGIEVNSKNILFRNQFNFIFGKISNNLQARSKSISLANPSRLEQVGVSLEASVLDNENRNWAFGEKRELDKRHAHIKSLTISRNIELESNSLRFSLASPYITFNIANYLRIKRGAFLGI